MQKTVSELFLENSAGECHKWANYLEVYERHFSCFRGRKPVILEIGVRRGGSLDVWKKYFGSDSTIVGIDIDPSCQRMQSHGFHIHIGDQSDENFLEKVLGGYQEFDVVIDDGSHIASHMIKSFEYIYPKMSANGIYVVEDVVPSIVAAKSSEGKLASFVDYASLLARQLNYGFASHPVLEKVNKASRNSAVKMGRTVGSLRSSSLDEYDSPSLFTAITKSILFYPNMVLFEKCPQGKRCAIKTGGMIPGELEIYSSYKAIPSSE